MKEGSVIETDFFSKWIVTVTVRITVIYSKSRILERFKQGDSS